MHRPIVQHRPISTFSEQILGSRLYKDLWLNNQYTDYFFTKFISDLSKDTVSSSLLSKNLFDGHKITHSHMIFVFMAEFIPPNPTQFVFYCALSESLPWLSFFFEIKKRKENVKVMLISMTVWHLQFHLKLTRLSPRNMLPPWSNNNTTTHSWWCTDLMQQKW